MTGKIIELEDVELTLGTGAARVHVLNDLSLSVRHGEAVGLVGPSGSGKSTLLTVIAGLERPDRGRVVLDGTDLGGLDEDGLARLRGRRVGIVFQSFHLVPTMTALENVALPLEIAGREGAFARAEAELAAVGLRDRMGHYPAQLSGGEQQRVAIARALAPDPALIVADEPTGNLDEATGQAVAALLFGLRQERGSPLVLVPHDPDLAERCGRIVHIRAGRIVESAHDPVH